MSEEKYTEEYIRNAIKNGTAYEIVKGFSREQKDVFLEKIIELKAQIEREADAKAQENIDSASLKGALADMFADDDLD